ncbi:relaxase/mobilization nuclease domain-containing protein [Megamonas hypermegale]|uniref:relaxase/mobilization nuclease domain-containing protein n=1 Tax=Megamonas hypermegale TaxID=158847 RepID=UPI00195937D4|nr:relaxase/mobilization nuclease domain-containing protein [Megamonas hypermegale]MBM6760557.1 relaxase/mobilization nuclease domain-containing protein [Megamonas hypermegale]MBM6834032.1 relaxase/mobilization nuclease domain-containing protein [Megamonas hypermegale]
MAIIKITKAGKTKASLKTALYYISEPQKITLSNGEVLLSTLNCWGTIQNIYETMISTKEMYRKATDNKNSEMYKHFQQSFKPNELTPQLAHKIGIKWADQNFGKQGFEICICTHIDKEHIHNHFIINSVNPITGKTIVINANKTLEQLKFSSDEICREYGLSVIDRNYYVPEKTQAIYSMKKKYSIERETFKTNSWQNEIHEIIKEAIIKSQGKSFEFFCQYLKQKKIMVDYKRLNNDLIFQDETTGYKISDKTLEKTFPTQGYFLRLNIEKLVGKIPDYQLEIAEILSPQKQGFYKLIENLLEVIDSNRFIETKEDFYKAMEKDGWEILNTLTGKCFCHKNTGRLFYDSTIYKITKKHEYCLNYLEQNLN